MSNILKGSELTPGLEVNEGSGLIGRDWTVTRLTRRGDKVHFTLEPNKVSPFDVRKPLRTWFYAEDYTYLFAA